MSAPVQAAASAPFALAADTAGRLRASGPLTFATARTARLAGLEALQAAADSLEVDLSGVTGADSAGLAVLVDWLAAARLAGRHLRLRAVPAGLLALARISELEPLLASGV